jgi:hypothetical protein
MVPESGRRGSGVLPFGSSKNLLVFPRFPVYSEPVLKGITAMAPALEPIFRREFAEIDRMELQETVARRVEAAPDFFLKKYEQDPRSFAGRYVCSDLFKELFPEYSRSKEARTRYNAVVHNSAAVLAAAQFHRLVSDPARPGNQVVFLTGIPGAGKTSSIISGGDLPPQTRVVFEGQLWKPETTFPKIQAALGAQLSVAVVVVHSTPERALENTFIRFSDIGRGASTKLMAEIQAGLPNGLAEIKKAYGGIVRLLIHDNSDNKNIIKAQGWHNLPMPAREGNYAQIKQRLDIHLQRCLAAEKISDACCRQAKGIVDESPVLSVTVAGVGRMERPDDQGHAAYGRG